MYVNDWLCRTYRRRAGIMPLFFGPHHMRAGSDAVPRTTTVSPLSLFHAFAFFCADCCNCAEINRYFTAIMSEVLKACGHNPDLCLTVTGFGEAGAALVASPKVDKIIFTGSPQV